MWDRLVDDLPGLIAETSSLHSELSEELGASELDALEEGGPRAIEKRVDLSEETRRKLHFLVTKNLDRRRIDGADRVEFDECDQSPVCVRF